MRIEVGSEPGKADVANEDFAGVAVHGDAAPGAGRVDRVASGGAVVVLDGVTPPPDGNDGCRHGVAWFSAKLGSALLGLAGSRRDLALADCLAEAITATAAAHSATCDLSHRLSPQATVVAARWDAQWVEHLVLSDSALLLESAERGGAVTAVLDDRIDRLRTQDVRVAPLRNVEGGFFTAAADPAVAVRAVTGRTPRASVRALAALTDGATRAVEVFGADDWAGTFALLRKAGPEALIARVRELENADPQGAAVPRGKPHDDATAVLVEL